MHSGLVIRSQALTSSNNIQHVYNSKSSIQENPLEQADKIYNQAKHLRWSKDPSRAKNDCVYKNPLNRLGEKTKNIVEVCKNILVIYNNPIHLSSPNTISKTNNKPSRQKRAHYVPKRDNNQRPILKPQETKDNVNIVPVDDAEWMNPSQPRMVFSGENRIMAPRFFLKGNKKLKSS